MSDERALIAMVDRLRDAGEGLADWFECVRLECSKAAAVRFGREAGIAAARLDPRVERALDVWQDALESSGQLLAEVERRAAQK